MSSAVLSKSNKHERCLVIGHRGASGTEPENTMRSFAAAHRMGADGIELDIFLSADKKIIVTHDENTRRLTGERMNVMRSTYQDLKKLDFGKGEKIPLLAEVFEEFLNKFKVINVEIKSTGLKTNGIEVALAALIKKIKGAQKILVSSFNPLNLGRFKKLMPEVKIGYLLCREQIVLARNQTVVRLLKPDTLNLDKAFIKYKKYQKFFEMLEPKWIWTVNTPEEMQFWLKKKPQAIITNFPDRLLALL